MMAKIFINGGLLCINVVMLSYRGHLSETSFKLFR